MKKTISSIFTLLLGATALGQAPIYQKPESPVPVLTGYGGFTTTFGPGQQQLQPTMAPLLLVPFGENWLIEAEGEFEGSYTHQSRQPWEREWDKGVEYLQADYFANRYITVVGGRFLTPFGIFNERLHSGWIRNLPAEPLIAPMGEGSANGGMLRGAIPVRGLLNINYAGFFSAGSTVRAFEASRQAGGRISLFFPGRRFEVGSSFRRILESKKFNTFGIDFTWQLSRIPLDLRGEFARSAELGKGYWIEAAYRTRRIPFAKAFFRNSQAVMRMEQFFRPTLMDAAEPGGGEEGGHGEGLPTVNTQRFNVGWNYWIRPDVRASFAYGRSFSAEGDRNIWQAGVTYRFALPLSGGSK